MSIPALNSNMLSGNSSYTVDQVIYSGKTFKVIAVLTGILSLVAIAAAIALQSIQLAMAGIITLTFTVVASYLGFKETKNSYTTTQGECFPIVIEHPRRHSSPRPVTPISGPTCESASAASMHAQEEMRHAINISPPATPDKPPTPIQLEKNKSVESPTPKKGGLTSYFSKG